jgi:glycosyltransferase involved in cell wall biosynthesis
MPKATLIEKMKFTAGKKSPVRIAVLNSHPIQYFAPLYAYLNAATDLDVTALYLSDVSIRGGWDQDFNRNVKWDLDLLQGYRSVFLGRDYKRATPAGFWSLRTLDVWREIRSGRYDVLWLHGHNYAACLIALAAAKSKRMAVFMRSETHLGLPKTGLKSKLRQPLLNLLYRLCDRLLAIGTANSQFYRAMGAPERKIVTVPYSVDNDRFVASTALDADQRRDICARLGIPTDRPTILYAAKFTGRKRPMDLLKAVDLIAGKVSAFSVVMAGTGELEPELRRFCLERGFNNVHFTGFINQTELPRLYGAADIFVLPSQDEPWGLAINEAMCARLPIVVSQEVGCVPDLVRDGINGFTPKAGDIEALARALATLIEDADLRQDMGAASLSRIRQWGYRECLQGIRGALVGLPGANSAHAKAVGEQHC